MGAGETAALKRNAMGAAALSSSATAHLYRRQRSVTTAARSSSGNDFVRQPSELRSRSTARPPQIIPDPFMYRTRSSSSASSSSATVYDLSFWQRPSFSESAMASSPTPRWKVLFRKLRAETRKKMSSCCTGYCRPSSAPNFHYDALSYAMNFDDGGGIAVSRRPLEIYSRANSRTQLRPSTYAIPA